MSSGRSQPPRPSPPRGRRKGKEPMHDTYADDSRPLRKRRAAYVLRIVPPTDPPQPIPPHDSHPIASPILQPAPASAPQPAPTPTPTPTPPLAPAPAPARAHAPAHAHARARAPRPAPDSQSTPAPQPTPTPQPILRDLRSCPCPPAMQLPSRPTQVVSTQPLGDTPSPHGVASSSTPGSTSAAPSPSHDEPCTIADSNSLANMTMLWPSKMSADVITATLKDMWRHKLPSYGHLKKDERISFFDRFRLYATWDPHQEVEIEKLFHKRMSSQLRGILCEARAAGRRPNWLQPDIWNYLCQHWQTDEYKHLQEVGKANRASEKGGSLHTGGRKTALDHAKTMAEKLGRSVYLDEVFAQTHIKLNGEWVDSRSRTTHLIGLVLINLNPSNSTLIFPK
ncbi:hypothetical protein RIF29_10014 [Crotalaria pallida]|uniref:Transposase n=1 Tax=Crotalaria pallida TaxID=3830 RepID=A0AAN9FSD0_CROPI